jgi:pimeloyl-ACP methyl ester carboxylesterase
VTSPAQGLRTLTTADGAHISYARSGAPGVARALVLVHGVASNMSRWSEFVGQTTLGDWWALLRLDLRGQGRSVHRGRIGMAEWCADLAAILRAEGVARAVVVGHCLGANIALQFAARVPALTAGLVMVEPMPPDALAGNMRRIAHFRPLLVALGWLTCALNAFGLRRRRLAELDLEQLDRETRAALAAGPGGEALLARYASPLADLRSTPTGAYLQALTAVTAPWPNLKSITAPVLALVSARSTFTDLRRTRAALGALPECEIVELDARHWIPTEQPQAMRAAIEAWVTRRFPHS